VNAEDRAILARGVALFNDGEYFECHETWEKLWKRSEGEERAALQGLIQAAVAILHAERGNRRGALSVYRKAIRNLERVPPDCIGIKLTKFRSALNNFFADVGTSERRLARPKLAWCAE